MPTGIFEEQEIIITAYVYALWDKNESDVFYIGVTQNPKSRLSDHRRNAGDWNEAFHRYILPIDRQINMKIIEEINYPIENIEELWNAERYWIHKFLLAGHNLINKQLYTSIKLKNIPEDVINYILSIHKIIFPNKKGVSQYNQQLVIFQIIREHKEFSESKKIKNNE